MGNSKVALAVALWTCLATQWPPLANAQPLAEISRRFDAALALIPAGRNVEAAAAFDDLARVLDGDAPVVIYLRATALTNAALALGNTPTSDAEILDRLRQALDAASALPATQVQGLGPDAATRIKGVAWTLMGQTLSRSRDWVAAVAAARKALDLLPAPDDYWRGQAYSLLGRLLSRGTAWKEGNHALEQAVLVLERVQEPAQLEQALSSVLGYHRDPSVRRAARDRLATLDFTATASGDAPRLIALAEYAVRDGHDASEALAFLDRVSQPPAAGVAYRFHVARAAAMLLANRLDAAAESIALARESRPQDSQLVLLELRLAEARGDSLRVLALAKQLEADALDLRIRTPDALAGDQLGSALLYEASVHAGLGQLSQALDLVRRAISLFAEHGYADAALDSKLTYVHLWQMIDPLGREERRPPPEWRRALNELHSECERAAQPIRSKCLVVSARGLIIERRTVEAERVIRQVDASLVPVSLQSDFAYARVRVALDLGRVDEAARLLSAAPRPETLPRGDQQAALELAGSVSERQRNFESALASYTRALQMGEEDGPTSSALSFQVAAGDAKASLYDRALTLAWRLGRAQSQEAPAALDLALRAMLPLAPIERTPPSRDVENALSKLAGQRLFARLMPAQRRAHPQDAFSDAVLRENFNRHLANYFAAVAKPDVATVSERSRQLQRTLASQSAHRQIRVYYMGSRIGVCFVWQGGKLIGRYWLSAAAVKSAARAVDQWRDAIVSLADETSEAQQANRRLMALLFPDGWERSPEEIRIVAHGALWRLPFETLIVSKVGAAVRYLDEVRTITYATPVSLSRPPRQGASRARAKGYFLLYPSLRGISQDPFPDTTSLPSALRAAGIPAAHVVTGASATETLVYTPALARAPWLHVTSHTDQENPYESSLSLLLTTSPALAGTRIEAIPGLNVLSTTRDVHYQHDGSLSIRDLQTLDLKARLVFLHGCQSLTGRVSQSVGVVGLGTAFLVAGAEAVVASHWDVPADGPLNREVAAFYTRFSTAPVIDNLRMLRAALRAESRHPYVWAAFSLLQ